MTLPVHIEWHNMHGMTQYALSEAEKFTYVQTFGQAAPSYT